MKSVSSEGSFERELKGGDKKEFKPLKHKKSIKKGERMVKRRRKRRKFIIRW